ncbi:hypothetical protein CPB84DRAFT_1815730 [Gymnopilus junonius]|uniref:Amine oxidase domain-containing protein n=1 Tax=Gymnopilus junonius TaxID=109634 RepID=A0A9P5NP51_GYMJU|nr:hypothetical protein CPB84DRAFT_1815730 [Gymnopilus junonius]
MMLKYLGIPYVVYEASERYGGRVYTYHFKEREGEPASTQNYFDVGAMRFPDNAANARTFELFKELGITKEGGEGGKLLPYQLNTDENVPDEYIKKKYVKPNGEVLYGVDACLGAAFEPYKFLLARDYKLGWELLMQHDSRSTRGHLLDIMRYPAEVVQWMETRDSGSNAYEDAFTEAMYKSLGPTPNGQDVKAPLEIVISGLASLLPIKASHVVSTVSLSCLRTINTSRCDLDYNQKTALRSLKYGTGVKVGIKFRTRWWQGQTFEKQGGSSKTDRQSRVVVYPSYGVDGPADSPGVLIATYAWNQDAFRFGSLIEPKDWGKNHEVESSTSEEFLLNQLYDDLAAMHGQPPEWYRQQTLDYFAYDWYHNRYTMGGYAFFGAGQFSDLYLEITKPASDGYLHFGGEAASCHHAWIGGALDSAWRCVWEILAKDGTQKQKGVYANSLEKPGGNDGTFHYP